MRVTEPIKQRERERARNGADSIKKDGERKLYYYVVEYIVNIEYKLIKLIIL